MAQDTLSIWQSFAKKHNLSETQLEQFKVYYHELVQANELFNITAITQLKSVIAYHFEDSLKLAENVDMNTIATLADVGTGGGFPALPLKIKFPHLSIILIEVSFKKREFLQQVCEKLNLTQVEFIDLDWRTFLRKTDYHVDLFCARASLQPEELLRMYQPSSPYKNAQLVYWASDFWQPNPKEAKYMTLRVDYQVANRKRAYVFFALSDHGRLD